MNHTIKIAKKKIATRKTATKVATRSGKKAGTNSTEKCPFPHAKTDYLDFTYPTMSSQARKDLDVGNIYENKIECKKCRWIIRSKNRHDYVKCKCGNVAVDGGSWYSRIVGKQDGYISHITYFKYKHKDV